MFAYLTGSENEKQQELQKVQGTSKEEMWETDLSEFLSNLERVEAMEAEENAADTTKVVAAGGKGALDMLTSV